jgi:release factor glutamine methyltransferase
MKLEPVYHNFVEQLRKIYDERETFNIADMVFESVAGIKRIHRITSKQQQLATLTLKQLSAALQKLLTHQPVQYVLGEAWFYKLKFFVNEHVLIPRPETEELVEWIVSDIRHTMCDVQSNKYQIDIIDIGTGSGCIAVALKKELPAANILGIDISAEAISVARKNAADQNTNIKLSELDFLDEITWHQLNSFNVIVSNPPYIPAAEKTELEKNVLEFEPYLALFTEDSEPLIFYKNIVLFAKSHLHAHGKIYVEVNAKYAGQVMNIFQQYNFTAIIKKDMYGNDRMIRATR